MWGREFSRVELVDVDAFADALERDAEWLYAKMLRPMIQVGMTMVPCFEAATGGGAEEDELTAESTGPSTDPGTEEPEVPKEKEVVYPKHLTFGKFELSDGRKVQGKRAAIEAQEALNEVP